MIDGMTIVSVETRQTLFPPVFPLGGFTRVYEVDVRGTRIGCAIALPSEGVAWNIMTGEIQRWSERVEREILEETVEMHVKKHMT